MKQFKTIFSFEYLGYAKNKLFIFLTAALIIIMAVTLFYPRFSGTSNINADSFSASQAETVIFSDETGENAEETAQFISDSLGDETTVTAVSGKSEQEIKALVEDGTYDMAVILTGPLSCKYIVNNASLNDETTYVIDEALRVKYQYDRLSELGVDASQSAQIISDSVASQTEVIGKDQTESFFYTYILMFLLYISVMLYGQFVAQSVASEKSSRAMELLVTSAKPLSLMFGKIIGAGAAGLTQLVLILGSAFAFYSVNKDAWSDNYVVQSIFGVPVSMLLYTVLFFILGFFLYAFMYGALASLASRLEDINMLTLPVNFLFIFSFLITIFSILGNVDSPLMKAASFIPFTSPMAMFARIAMGSVANWEIVLSVAVLVVSTVLTGYLAAIIYRAGVLMYGKPPKINELVRALKSNKK